MRCIRGIGWGLVSGVALVAQSAVAGAQDDGASSAEPDVVEAIQTSFDGEAAAADTTESITVSITEQGPTEEVAASPAVISDSTEAETSSTKASGWARESLEFYPYDGGLHRGSDDVLGVPRDRLLSRTQLLVRASYRRGRWFEAAISGSLGLAVHVEGSGQDMGLRSWGSQGTVELLDATLREAYLGFFGRHFDLRIGQQRVAWGVADIFSPNDVVNARDTRDPFLSEQELTRLPTPVVRATGYLGIATFELLFSPVFVPDRFSLYGGNWAAIQRDAPAAYRGLFALTTRAVDPSIQENVNQALYQTRLPNRNGRGYNAGAKLGLHGASVDFNFYYQYGFDGTPYFWLNPALAGVLQNTDFRSAGFQDLAPVLRAIDQSVYPIYAEYVRRHHVGFDMVAPLGPFMLRLDAAYQSRRVFYHQDLTSMASPTVLGVVSLDYQTGSVDKVLIVEAVYIRILDELSAPLLAYKRDSYGVAGAFRWPLFSVFGIELRAIGGIAPLFYMAQPALVIKAQNFTIKLGGMFLNGESYSFGSYYRHNASAYLQVRYNF